jgi:hypothetical protein
MVWYVILFAALIYMSILAVIIKCFLGHIIIFDSILLGLLVGEGFNMYMGLQSLKCVIIGVIVCLVLLAIQMTKYGFWIVGIFFSWFWAEISAELVYDALGKDKLWYYITLVVSFVIMIGIHKVSKENDTQL